MEDKTNQTQPLKRTFIIGDEWLYYKFYSGPKTADVLLSEMVKPLCEQFLEQGLIDHWFFIRYSDPKLHIRLRLHIPDPNGFTAIITSMHNAASPFIEQKLVWKVQADTYEREIERYGINSMDLSEKLFFHDSRMIVTMLSMIEGDEGERIRWLFALRTIDVLLDDFGLNMEQKFDLITQFRENFGREFGLNRRLKEQLEAKFRKDRPHINELLDRANDEVSEMNPLFQLLYRKSSDVKPIVEQILTLNSENRLFIPLNDLISSYSHMMVNRVFKSKQRLHELVMYDFLHRYYKSEIARRKYSAVNAQKKKEKGKKDKEPSSSNSPSIQN